MPALFTSSNVALALLPASNSTVRRSPSTLYRGDTVKNQIAADHLAAPPPMALVGDHRGAAALPIIPEKSQIMKTTLE